MGSGYQTGERDLVRKGKSAGARELSSKRWLRKKKEPDKVRKSGDEATDQGQKRVFYVGKVT